MGLDIGNPNSMSADDNKSASPVGSTGTGFGFAATTEKESIQTPSAVNAITRAEEEKAMMEKQYIDTRYMTIKLKRNDSLYRKMNDKTLPRRTDYIGSCVRSSRTLASNTGEINAYFPALIGVSPNNENFTTRVKQYLNNFKAKVDELGLKLNISFRYNKRIDYLHCKSKEDAIDAEFQKADKSNLEKLRAAIEVKINAINELESSKWQFGAPVDLEQYLLYRHCLLYSHVSKDVALINVDSQARFYFSDDTKELELMQRRRLELNAAKRNYIRVIGDEDLFRAVYIQYCVSLGLPVSASLSQDRLDRENQLDRYSMEEPIKFNKIVSDKDIDLKSLLELLISKGYLVRSTLNQNISTVDGEFIGANMKDAVIWAKNPDNEQILLSFKNRLKYS